jgi:hypothetical protein
MYNAKTNTLLIISASPSQQRGVQTIIGQLTTYKKTYGKDVKMYKIYTREPNTWPIKSKDSYNSLFERVRKTKGILGVSFGLSGLEKNLNDINMGNKLY